MASDAWMSCERFLKDYFDVVLRNTQHLTTQCMRSYTDPLYETDPCCNSVLKSFMCCHPRHIDLSLLHVSSLNEQLLARTCTVDVSNIGDLLATIRGHVWSTQMRSDAEGGCFKSAFSSIGEHPSDIEYIFYDLDFFNDCVMEIYSSNPCEKDSDCESGLCLPSSIQGRYCALPDEPDTNLVRCLLRKMPSRVRKALRLHWDLESADPALFEAELRSRLVRETCVGENAAAVSLLRSSSANHL